MNTSTDLLTQAMAYLQGGLSFYPIGGPDKQPAYDLLPRNEKGKPVWSPFQKSPPIEKQVTDWCASPKAYGLSGITGDVSGGACVLDFDVVAGIYLFEQWLANGEDLTDGLPVTQTPSGGYHVGFRCEGEWKSTILAYLPNEDKEDGREAAIELKAGGTPFTLAGTPGYKVVDGDWTAIPRISVARAKALIEAARALDRMPYTRQQLEAQKRAEEAAQNRPKSAAWRTDGQDSIIDRYNSENDIRDVLIGYGYMVCGQRLKRPGGQSASVTIFEDTNRSFHHSANDPLHDLEHSHDPFSIYCHFEHGGNSKAGVKTLAGQWGVSLPAKAGGESNTWPFETKDGQTFLLKREEAASGEIVTKRTIMADFEARIVEEITSEEGDRWFGIAGKTVQGRAFAFEINAPDFSENRRLKAALVQATGARAPIRTFAVPRMYEAIQTLTNSDLQEVRRYDRTGWAGGHFLLPGREPDSATRIYLPRKLPYSYNPDADLDKGLEAMKALLIAMPLSESTVALTPVFEAPLAKLAGWLNERYGLFISARSGRLKTSWSQVALSVYGPGFMRDDQLIKWGEGATRNAIMKLATHAHDLPLLIDNYKPGTGEGARGFINLIHNILEGGEKDRLNRAAELRETKPVFCWPIVTGEDVPDKDPAALARILVVKFTQEVDGENEELSRAQKLAEHLSAVGHAWLSWLESDEGRAAARDAGELFPGLRGEWVAWLQKKRADIINPHRVASNITSSALTWQVLGKHPTIGPIVNQFAHNHHAGLEIVASDMACYTAEALEATRFLAVLRELLATGRGILLNRGQDMPPENDRDRMLGWKDLDGSMYFLPKVARQMVDRLAGDKELNEVSSKTLYAQLESLGAIASHDRDKLAKTIKVAGKGQKTLHLTPKSLVDDENGPDK